MVLDHQQHDALVEAEAPRRDPVVVVGAAQRRIEAAREQMIMCRVGRPQRSHRSQRCLGRERQRGCRGPASERAVVGPVRRTARGVAEAAVLLSCDLHHARVGALACGEAPCVIAIADKAVRVALRVLGLNADRAPRVLEVVAALLAHEAVADAAKVDPRVRVEMNEERAGVENIGAVQMLPLIGQRPRLEAALGQRMRRRARAERVQDDAFAVALPAVVQKAALGLPAVQHAVAAVARPGPVDASVQRIGELADVALVARRRIEVDRGVEHAGDQQRGVDHRQLRGPDPRAAAHVEEVVVEALEARRLRAAALVARVEEMQRGERAPRGVSARHPAALDADDVGRQREADDRDAARRVGARGVGDQAVVAVGVDGEIVERGTLDLVQQQFIAIMLFEGSRHAWPACGLGWQTAYLLFSASARARPHQSNGGSNAPIRLSSIEVAAS